MAPSRDRSSSVKVATTTERPVAAVMITRPTMHDPEVGLDTIRAFFEDSHVHMALIVARDGRLVTAIERADLAVVGANSRPVSRLGALTGRTVGPADPITTTTAALLRQRRRRLAVIDQSGRLIGLLCLKKDGTGFCSDDDIRARRG